MIRIPKSVVSFGAVALAAGALTVAVPRAAHAVAAALVQVSNSPASPANTEDTSKQASQLVNLQCVALGLSYYPCSQVTPAGLVGGVYSVPSNAYLVINSIDFNNQVFPVSALTAYLLPTQRSWSIPGAQGLSTATTTEFQYPAGIVIGPGVSPQIDVNGGTNQIQLVVNLSGYLTGN